MAQGLNAQNARTSSDREPEPAAAWTRLLGFAPSQGLAALLAALQAVPGPKLAVRAGPGVAALLQPEPATPLAQRGRAGLLASLQTVQRRLELACQAGPFLPADPASACCPEEAVPRLLEPAWDRLGAALARHGRRHQWDIVLRWPAPLVLARHREAIARAASGLGRAGLADAVAATLRADRARREAALIAALDPAVLALAATGAAGAETGLMLTAQVPAGGEAVLEAALEGLAPEHVDGASLDLRGPLPPLSFASVRVTEIDAEAVARAWSRLDLPAGIDAAGLHRHWRRRAFTLHPDRHATAAAARFGAALSEATESYHLLRDLLAEAVPQGGLTGLADLLGCAGYRLSLPVAPDPLDDEPLDDELLAEPSERATLLELQAL